MTDEQRNAIRTQIADIGHTVQAVDNNVRDGELQEALDLLRKAASETWQVWAMIVRAET